MKGDMEMKELEREEQCCPLCQMLEETEGIRLSVPYDEIVGAGVELPPAEEMSDAEVSRTLDRMIEALAGMNVCVTSTDHLSDRELYRRMCDDVLREPTEVFPGSELGVTTIDIIGGCSEEDIQVYLTYYADDETREMWASDWPEDPLPEKKPHPYDRDRLLPTLYTLLGKGGH